jgi:hypothetical protein
MDSQASAALAPQQVSGQSAFWILVTLALAAVTQPSIASRREMRRTLASDIDVLRSFPATCLFDGIIDLIALGRAMGDTYRLWRAPLTTNVVTAKLTMWMLAVLPQAIKVFSMRGIPVTQCCAGLYFFAATTKIMVDFSCLEMDGYYPGYGEDELGTTRMLIMLPISIIISLGQVAFETLIWCQITHLAPISKPQLVQNIGEWVSLVVGSLMFLQLLVWGMRIPFRGSPFGPYAVPILGIYILYPVSIIGRGNKLGDTTPKWSDTLPDAICRGFCIVIVSILAAKAIRLVGHLIARWGHFPTQAPDSEASLAYPETNYAAPADSKASVPHPDPNLVAQSTSCVPEDPSVEPARARRYSEPILPIPADFKDSIAHPLLSIPAPTHLQVPVAHPEPKVAPKSAHSTLGNHSHKSSWLTKCRWLLRKLESSMGWTLTLGSRIDRRLARFLHLADIEGVDDTIILIVALTIFNVLTTVFYYLLLFDGTGTESPNWVSYLG